MRSITWERYRCQWCFSVMPSVCITLKHHWRLYLSQVIERITPRFYQSHAVAALTHVRLQNEWQRDGMLAAESMKRQEPVGRWPTIEQEGLRYRVGARGV